MDANHLRLVFDAIYLLAIAVWLGSALLASLVIAPLACRLLDRESAAALLREVFPRLSVWGAVSGALALPCLVGVPLAFPEFRGPWIGAQALLLIASVVAMLPLGESFGSRGQPSSEANLPSQVRRSNLLIGFVVLILLTLIAGFAARPLPKTAGIVELSPIERTKRSLESFRIRERPLGSGLGPSNNH